MSRGVAIVGWGKQQPDTVVTNADWAARLDTSDEWIVERTGIRSRRVGGTTVELAADAARVALGRSGRSPADLGLVIVATTSPDRVIPPTSTEVAGRLGTRCGAFDLGATCAGFVYGLVVGSELCAGLDQPVLVIGADTITRLADPTDRSMAVLFGDGAGAVVLAPNDHGSDLLGSSLGCDAEYAPILHCATGGYMYMAGRDVFLAAVHVAEESSLAALKDAGVTVDDVDLFVPHQANARIMEALARRLGLGADRLVNVIGHSGNTSSASIPMALAEAREAGRLQAGDVVLLTAFGGGMTVASAVVRWSVP
jgi:3-oxoacyl-[acyl-carrier-protein] synthase-3